MRLALDLGAAQGPFKIMVELCELIGYKFTHNKNTEELLGVVKRYLNKGSTVLAFDEIDKVEDFDFLYHLLEGLFRKSIFLITNYKECVLKLDERPVLASLDGPLSREQRLVTVHSLRHVGEQRFSRYRFRGHDALMIASGIVPTAAAGSSKWRIESANTSQRPVSRELKIFKRARKIIRLEKIPLAASSIPQTS